MQKVTVLCVGKLKEKFYTEAAAEYAKRLSRYCKLELLELPEERLPENPSPAQIEAALSREAEAVRARLSPSACLIALCVEGTTCSSEELARRMAEEGFVDQHDHFVNTTEGTEWESCLAHAEKIGLGSRRYELVAI